MFHLKNKTAQFAASIGTKLRSGQQRLIASTVESVEQYPTAVKVMHWGMGGAMLGCIGFVQAAKNTKGKTKGEMMFYHKSCGLLAMGLLGPRLWLRFTSKMPGPITKEAWEVLAAKAAHFALYSLTAILPITGVLMGYFGGKGLPFFFTTVPGAKGEDKSPTIAKYSFKVHSLAGQALEYVLVAHVAAVSFHMAQGRAILTRIVPGISKW